MEEVAERVTFVFHHNAACADLNETLAVTVFTNHYVLEQTNAEHCDLAKHNNRTFRPQICDQILTKKIKRSLEQPLINLTNQSCYDVPARM